MKKLRVGVIYGGRSGEHEVSLASAAAVFKHLDNDRYEPIAIRIDRDGRWTLPPRPPSIVSAADVIHAKSAERVDSAPEAHLVAHPGGDTLFKIDRRDGQLAVAGLGLDVVFPVLQARMARTDGSGLFGSRISVGAGVLASAVGMAVA